MAKVIIHFEDKKINSYQQDKQLYFVEGTIYKRTNLDFTEINNWLNNLNGFLVNPRWNLRFIRNNEKNISYKRHVSCNTAK